MNIFLAIILGLLFGIILQKVGASNPKRIINMLRLKDLHLIKAILFAIGLSSLLLFSFISLGIVESAHVSVKSAYVGVFVGGLIFGIGWAVSGFCPGTSIVSLGEGRKDAVVFVLGGLLGAFLFMLAYGSLKGTFLFDQILGGKVTVANLATEKYATLTPDMFGIVVAGSIAILLILIAFKLPNKLNAS